MARDGISFPGKGEYPRVHQGPGIAGKEWILLGDSPTANVYFTTEVRWLKIETWLQGPIQIGGNERAKPTSIIIQDQ